MVSTSYLKNAHKATAISYLHVLWVGAETFESLSKEHREGLMLTRLWASVYAAGNAILDDYKRHKVQGSQIRIGYGGRGKVSPKEVERRINSGELSVVPSRTEAGLRQCIENIQVSMELVEEDEKEVTLDHLGRKENEILSNSV